MSSIPATATNPLLHILLPRDRTGPLKTPKKHPLVLDCTLLLLYNTFCIALRLVIGSASHARWRFSFWEAIVGHSSGGGQCGAPFQDFARQAASTPKIRPAISSFAINAYGKAGRQTRLPSPSCRQQTLWNDILRRIIIIKSHIFIFLRKTREGRVASALLTAPWRVPYILVLPYR